MMKFNIFTLIILLCGFTLHAWVVEFNKEIDERVIYGTCEKIKWLGNRRVGNNSTIRHVESIHQQAFENLVFPIFFVLRAHGGNSGVPVNLYFAPYSHLQK